jgi:hypothetical protein
MSSNPTTGPDTVRTYLADGQDAEKILTVARAIRERAGTLSGIRRHTRQLQSGKTVTVRQHEREGEGDAPDGMVRRPGNAGGLSPDRLPAITTAAFAEILERLKPQRRMRTSPRVIKRARHNTYRVKTSRRCRPHLHQPANDQARRPPGSGLT